MTSVEQRIEELEIRLAEQEKTIAELNEVITAQWKKLDGLERAVQRLGEELQTMEPADAPANQKPPHY